MNCRRTLVFVVFLLTIPAVSYGQELGPIQNLNDGLRRVLKMKWEGDRLAIDRAHWDEWVAETVEDDIQPRELGRAPFRRVRKKYPTVIRLFDSYLDSDRALRGHSKSIGNLRDEGGQSGRLLWEAAGLQVAIQIYQGDFKLRIVELDNPHRVFRVYEDKDGLLRISIVEDAILRIQQSADGTTSVVYMNDDKAFHLRETSFADLVKSHANEMKAVIGHLEHMGFVPPER